MSTDKYSQLMQSATGMLTADLSSIKATYASKIIAGWLRAAADQVIAITTMHQAKIERASAPNWRCLSEIAIHVLRLAQLPREELYPAIEGILASGERSWANHLKHMSDLGFDAPTTPDPDDKLPLVSELNGGKAPTFPNVLATAQQTKNAQYFYAIWHDTTQRTHATAVLAADYAPNHRGGIGPTGDYPLKHHFTVLPEIFAFVCVHAIAMLKDLGLDEKTVRRLLDAVEILDVGSISF